MLALTSDRDNLCYNDNYCFDYDTVYFSMESKEDLFQQKVDRVPIGYHVLFQIVVHMTAVGMVNVDINE